MPDSNPAPAAPLRIGWLFSGYGGLDLAVEQVFATRTVWFSEINQTRRASSRTIGPASRTSAT